MNSQEKEAYLREYSLMKSKGKPFFPYAVAKDGAMACVVMFVIILMSLVLGAELGPKADPTTTTYVPRPEWYFFFLFELLRVIKPAVLTPMATIGIPTICMILLLLLPFYDRSPERRRERQPAALTPMATIGIPTICMILLLLLPFYDRSPERRPERRPIASLAGLFTIAAMAYLTYLGAAAGSPNEIDLVVEKKYEPGKLVVAQSGCLACHKVGENGNGGPGPALSDIGNKLPKPAIRQTLENPTAPMPSYRALPEEKKAALVDFLAQLKGEKATPKGEE